MPEGGFLPPEPPGPEPELEPRGRRPPPPTCRPAPPPAQWQPPAPQWQQPAAAWPQPAPWGQPWGYAPAPPVPDNAPAVGGFISSLVSLALLLPSAGMSSIVSVGTAIFGIVYSRRGRRRVQAGVTPKHRGLATAGLVIGIIALIVSILATLLWGAIVVGLIVDDQFRHDFFNDDSGSSSFDAIRIALLVARLLGTL